MVRCPAHKDRTPSLSVDDGVDGRLLVKCFAGCEGKVVLSALQQLGIADGPAHRVQPPRGRQGANADTNLSNRSTRAKRIWARALPLAGTLADLYLQERGLTGPWPPTLRFHPGVDYYEAGWVSPVILPALVGAIAVWPSHFVEAVQVTYLNPRHPRKAQVSTPRKSYGRVAGGAIRLARAEDRLLIGEGAETVMSVMRVTGLPGWATTGTSGLRNLNLPAVVRTLTITADGDGPGERAAQAAANRWTSEGRTVRIARAPVGHDFNDFLMGAVHG